MTTFAALGDSITVGVGDPMRPAGPDGRPSRGWAALLADGLPEPDLHMFAANGARVRDIERDQLPRALALRPDVASVVFGANDTVRPGFDPDRIAAAAAQVVGGLRAAGAEVLTMRLPDPGPMLGLPGPLARPLARRARAINSVMDGIAAQFGTLHFDAAGAAETYEKRMWAVDRLHPSERGHRHIARRFYDLLATAGHPMGPAPDPEPDSRPPARLAELGWLATKGTGLMLRRSTQVVPYLIAMAATEMWALPRHSDPLRAPLAAGPGPRPEDGVAVVVDLASYRRARHPARGSSQQH
ncbi:MAG: SGNH/GDSL hydrolase family protein [Streptosporangiaceae bacterium]|jgi:lysophospholipase L1-like esterase